MATCGESKVTKADSWPSKYSLIEYKDFSWKLRPIPISEADRLNGIEVQGHMAFSYSAKRWSII